MIKLCIGRPFGFHCFSTAYFIMDRGPCVLACVFLAVAVIILGLSRLDASALENNNGCHLEVSTPPWVMLPIPSEFISLPQRHNFTFSVKSCHSVHLILLAFDGRGEVGMYEVILGGWDNKRCAIRHCVQCNYFAADVPCAPVNCQTFRSFYISWGADLKVGKMESGVPDKEPFLIKRDFKHSVNQVYVNNWYGVGAEWIIDGLCNGTEPEPEISSLKFHTTLHIKKGAAHITDVNLSEHTVASINNMGEGESGVSQGRLAGAVIGTLILGILTGSFGLLLGIRIVKRRQRVLKQEDPELATLVGVPAFREKLTASVIPVTQPGQPPITSDIADRTSQPNTYTPCSVISSPPKESKDGTRTPTSDVTSAKDHVTEPVGAEKKSILDRVASPLPALPSDVTRISRAVEHTESEELYTNADVHIYEGMKLESPIYENRDMVQYESLKMKTV